MLRSLTLTALALLATVACQRTETTTRTVNLHVASCQLASGSSGYYLSTGDYSPPGQSTLLPTDTAHLPIDGVASNVQSLALHVETSNPAEWWGITLVPQSGSIDMLMLPATQSCALSTNVGFAPGLVLGAVSPRTLIVGGAASGSPSFRVDLTTGLVDKMMVGMKQPRTNAAFAVLGNGGQAIVTGGIKGGTLVDPTLGGEIFDEQTGDFEPNPIFIAARADHAAVTLASGDVVLVGGYETGGTATADTQRITFSRGEWVSAAGPMLAAARTKPVALRLANGQVLVGGGFDSNGAAVQMVELWDAGFAGPPSTFTVVTRSHHSFVALDGGGALMVTAPDPTDDPNNFQRAWFIPPNAQAPVKVTPDVTTALTDVKLVPASGGRALLWTGSGWLSFDPTNGFSPLAVTSSLPTTAIVAPDPGLRAWVSSDGTLNLWRDSARNAFSTEGPYLATDAANTSSDTYPAPIFQPAAGMPLAEGETVFIADARFLDVGIDVHTPPGGALPEVVLRTGTGDDIVVGGSSCPLTLAGLPSLHVERSGNAVSVAFGGALQPCAPIAANARVSLGLRGGNAGSSVLGVNVTRLGTPQP